MKKVCSIVLLVILAMAFSGSRAGAQNEPAPNLGGRPNSEDARPKKNPPPVTYSTPTPEIQARQPQPAVPDDDFEKLYYQKEMWRQYQNDYQNNKHPQPRRP